MVHLCPGGAGGAPATLAARNPPTGHRTKPVREPEVAPTARCCRRSRGSTSTISARERRASWMFAKKPESHDRLPVTIGSVSKMRVPSNRGMPAGLTSLWSRPRLLDSPLRVSLPVVRLYRAA